jgi:FixJ family two-component response regulator
MGAAGYFRKPVDEQALVDAISFAAWKAGGQKT